MASHLEWVPRKRLRSKTSAAEYVSILAACREQVAAGRRRCLAAEPVARAGLAASVAGEGGAASMQEHLAGGVCGGFGGDLAADGRASELVPCPPFLLNVDSFRREYKRTWITPFPSYPG